MKRLCFPIVIFMMITGQIIGQNLWSLQKCVEQARENSISLKQNKLNIVRAQINNTQAVHNQYPRLNATANYGLNFGRTIDPVTNDFETKSIGNNSIGVSTGVLLFNGGFVQNNIKQSVLDLQTSKLDVDQLSEDLALNVVQYYIAILFAQDRLDNARIQVQTTTQQLDQIDKLIAAGSKPEGDRLEILAQQAREEQNIIVYENNVISNKLNLKQLLRLPIEQAFEIERPSPNVLQPSIIDQNLSGIYNYALEHRSDIKSGDLKIKSAELGVKIQQASAIPSISFGGNLNSLYSSLAQRRADGFTTVNSPVDVLFNGQNAHLDIINKIPNTEKNPYFSQLDENIGYGFGLSMSIPIYNNYRAKANVQRAEVEVDFTRLTSDQTKETLKNNIQTALNDMRATANTYEAAKRSTAAQRLAYNNAKTKFDLGSANTFELLTAKNKLDIAITEELISRYDYIFRSKVIDYYLGRRIALN
ncbi:MAG: TolC family protein [Saprospiraceae bacterium]